MSVACSAWSSVRFSPRTTWTTDSPAAGRWQRPPRRPRWRCHAGVSIHAPPTRRAPSGPGLCPALAVRPASGSPCSTPARWAHGSGGSRSPMPLATRMTGQFNAWSASDRACRCALHLGVEASLTGRRPGCRGRAGGPSVIWAEGCRGARPRVPLSSRRHRPLLCQWPGQGTNVALCTNVHSATFMQSSPARQ